VTLYHQIGVKMRLTYNVQDDSSHFERSLVTLKPGRYPVVGAHRETLEVDLPTHGLTIEHVGTHPDKSSCWHVLIDKSVILVWDDDMVNK
jgi:hypothetical protein